MIENISSPVPETWPYHGPDEIEAASRVLASGLTNYWTGDNGRRFEEEFAAYHGVRHAVALANGTVALEAALAALDIGPGDEVIVPARTFVASATAVVLRGARPVFADVDRDSGNITAETITDVLTPRTRAIITVHLGGWPCEMDPILALARDRGLYVIEDCAQSHGARYKGQLVGSLGDIGAFSFCQDKILSTGGEGGMVVTNNEQYWQSAWSSKDHGKSWEAVYEREHPAGFRWVHDSFGSNWRLTEVQAAIGRVQLTKLEGWVKRRQDNALLLKRLLGDLEALRIPEPPPHVKPAYYRFYMYIRPDRLRHAWTRDRVLATLTEHGVPATSGSCSEIYRERCFADAGLQPATRLRIAQELGETSVALPVHPTLSGDRLGAWAESIRAVVRGAAR
ncbi:MAG: DegT/DnrJ/EryC1/StrS aminotransferase family protein [Actinomycetia bacterium]|nr:DegT/DnrJ/EryC1/StrS aminotransferase family protein [Actinomycetes bacterium]